MIGLSRIRHSPRASAFSLFVLSHPVHTYKASPPNDIATLMMMGGGK